MKVKQVVKFSTDGYAGSLYDIWEIEFDNTNKIFKFCTNPEAFETLKIQLQHPEFWEASAFRMTEDMKEKHYLKGRIKEAKFDNGRLLVEIMLKSEPQ